MATSTYGTPYVQGSDLVSAYPTASSNLATRVDEVSYARNGLNAQTGVSYTLVAGDAGKTITLSNASAVAVTLPQDSTADLPDGAVVTFYNLGAGTVTISQGAGATLHGGSIALSQYEVTSVIKLSANTYGKFDGSAASGLYPATPTSIANSGGTATLASNTVTASGVTSVSFNGVFTSTYDNYRIMLEGSGSVQLNILMRMRLSGTDATTANYASQLGAANLTSATAAQTTGQTSMRINTFDTGTSVTSCDVFSPNLAKATRTLTSASYGLTDPWRYMFATVHNVATAYDGFTFTASTGTFSGTIRVYGYRQ